MTNFDSLCYQCKRVLGNIQKTLLWEYGLEIEIDKKPCDPHTDVLIMENLNLGKDLVKNYSLLYAVLEGASKALEIKREDIDATLSPQNENNYKIVLFDKVSAGAGFMKAVFDDFELVLRESLNIVQNCNCDEDTCCPVCLEHISNQYILNHIKRGEAKKVLLSLMK